MSRKRRFSEPGSRCKRNKAESRRSKGRRDAFKRQDDARFGLPPLGQLIIGIIGMILIANLQYGWTLFVHPMPKTVSQRDRPSCR
jgi:hypothetical protein